MKKTVSILSLSYLIFMFLLMASGMIGGILSGVIYFLAFAVPIIFALYADGRARIENEEPPIGDSLAYLRLEKKSVLPTLLTVFPTVLIVIGVSYVTSLIIMITVGAQNEVDIGEDLFVAILTHAFVPALLEEALFRYLPLRLFGNRNCRAAVLISSVFFAFSHHSLFSIPYAFIAGVIFMTVDLMFNSVYPSLIIHFINNVTSVLWIFYSDNGAFVKWYYILLSALALVSVTIIAVLRKDFVSRFRNALAARERYEVSYEPLLFILPCLILALLELA